MRVRAPAAECALVIDALFGAVAKPHARREGERPDDGQPVIITASPSSSTKPSAAERSREVSYFDEACAPHKTEGGDEGGQRDHPGGSDDEPVFQRIAPLRKIQPCRHGRDGTV